MANGTRTKFLIIDLGSVKKKRKSKMIGWQYGGNVVNFKKNDTYLFQSFFVELLGDKLFLSELYNCKINKKCKKDLRFLFK